ncbi:CRISPR-associated protein Cas2 [Rhodobium orientis]|uniref:CRISPR-associated endoribonuclease Cas2 n=1 Tax=Rhodobium orientis TaxID=34017 RepID=A0A327JLM7_9HYPH|nr:CRISPR-associated endonuclease Cas2 [Rhodobium orientis]MBB4302856.1 CRISPR-associated protein Cas2 [Rhodobium orientis]RAI26243.1 CRISPR-associated endonuclease Cas2 [Rhodobium orientis]
MAESEHTIVLCYDIARAKTRRRVADFLEDRLVRVQQSVFEGRMTPSRAYRLFDAAAALVDDGDNLRLYVLTREGLQKSRTFGGAPLPEEGAFILL